LSYADFDCYTRGSISVMVIREFSIKGRDEMNTVRIAAIVLILSGVLGLVYGSFSYTKKIGEVKSGSIELSIKEKQTVNIPVWAGAAAIVIGGLLLLLASSRRQL